MLLGNCRSKYFPGLGVKPMFSIFELEEISFSNSVFIIISQDNQCFFLKIAPFLEYLTHYVAAAHHVLNNFIVADAAAGFFSPLFRLHQHLSRRLVPYTTLFLHQAPP